jgi:uncharacterized protein YbjT (DUF2867 family)
MRIAITGGTGFVGRHLAARLRSQGHDVVAIGSSDADIADHLALARLFAGCDAVAHCAGINRQIGDQTYERVHVRGTHAVVRAAQTAAVKRLAIVSFLRARPDGPDPYHRSKWAAEEIVRASGLDWTVLKCGVIYGRGDHMLDHLSHAFHTFPVFPLVGMRDRPVRPVAVEDVARVLEAALTGDPRLVSQTVAVLGPEELSLREAVRRVASATGHHPLIIPAPVLTQLLVARVAELVMRVPLLAVAQAHILAEGIVEPLPFADDLPADLQPSTPFDQRSIRAGLPEPGGFGLRDLRLPNRTTYVPTGVED